MTWGKQWKFSERNKTWSVSSLLADRRQETVLPSLRKLELECPTLWGLWFANLRVSDPRSCVPCQPLSSSLSCLSVGPFCYCGSNPTHFIISFHPLAYLVFRLTPPEISRSGISLHISSHLFYFIGKSWTKTDPCSAGFLVLLTVFKSLLVTGDQCLQQPTSPRSQTPILLLLTYALLKWIYLLLQRGNRGWIPSSSYFFHLFSSLIFWTYPFSFTTVLVDVLTQG